MKRTLALLVSLLVVLPGALQAFYSFIEMKADALRKDPSIRIKVYESGDQVTFKVALRKSETPEACPYGSLGLVNPEGERVGEFALRGEDIRRVGYEALRAWGWEDFKPAEVFRFTVRSNLLTRSTFSWQHGPPTDEHGNPNTGGVIFSSRLKDLADAAENAKGGAAKGSQPTRSETNQPPAAAGSRR